MEHTQEYGAGRRLTVGALVFAIGVVHNLVGLVMGLGLLPAFEGAGGPLLDIARDGVVGAVEPHLPRMVFFWFVMTGFVMMIVGWLAHVMERRGPGLPRSFALVFGSFALAGVVLIPASGFWLGFVPAWLAWRRSSAARAPH